MRRLTIAGFALIFVIIGLYFMVQMFFGGLHLSIYNPPMSIFEPTQRDFVPEYPSPGPSVSPKLRFYGPRGPGKGLKPSPYIVPGPPLPGAAAGLAGAMPTATPSPGSAPTFNAVTPPPLSGVQLPVGFRTPTPMPSVEDVGQSPSPSPSPTNTGARLLNAPSTPAPLPSARPSPTA